MASWLAGVIDDVREEDRDLSALDDDVVVVVVVVNWAVCRNRRQHTTNWNYRKTHSGLKGILPKILLNSYICGQGGIIAGVTVHTMVTQLVQLSLGAME